jgi:predicted nucleotidyltransferase component of viral defense system
MMNIEIIERRLKTYTLNSVEDEEFALKEILQEIILFGLSNSDFFNEALFQGGTALRLFYGLPRFSEDLDFLLQKPNKRFTWKKYSDVIQNICRNFSITPEIVDKTQLDKNVQKMFLKDNSIGKILNLAFSHDSYKKLSIKLEIDINPPAGSYTEIKFLDFPIAYSTIVQDLSSNFAGKCHALLCRPYVKGRDWYDFLWYISQKVTPNFLFLSNAINQQGLWANQQLRVDPSWLIQALNEKMQMIDWQKAVQDVFSFLKPLDRQGLTLWNITFFQDRLNKLKSYMGS